MALELFRDLIFQRFFLGWDRPLPVCAADWFIDRYGDKEGLDLGQMLFVLPTTQTVLRMGEILAQKAGEKSLYYEPPEIITSGELPERLYQPGKPIAIEFEQTLAWSRILSRQTPEKLRPLLPTVPDEESLSGWLEIAGTLRRLSSDLAAHHVTFEDVLDHVETEAERRRWIVLGDLFRQYLGELQRAGLVDPFFERRQAIAKKSVRYGRPIFLIGTSDLNESVAKVVAEVDVEVISLVAAPSNRRGDFDFLGRLRPEAFLEDPLPIRDEQLVSTGDIADQAAIVSEIIDQFRPDYGFHQMTVGLTDESQWTPVEIELTDAEKPTIRHAGWTVPETGPGRLIERLARLVAQPTWESLAAFVRHAEVHRLVDSQIESTEEDFLGDVDQLLANHFPIDLIDPLPSKAFDSHPIAVDVRREVCKWISPFLPVEYGELPSATDTSGKATDAIRRPMKKSSLRKPISDWCIALRAWLDAIYRVGDKDDSDGQLTSDAVTKILDLLKRFSDFESQIGSEGDGTDRTRNHRVAS